MPGKYSNRCGFLTIVAGEAVVPCCLRGVFVSAGCFLGSFAFVVSDVCSMLGCLLSLVVSVCVFAVVFLVCLLG